MQRSRISVPCSQTTRRTFVHRFVNGRSKPFSFCTVASPITCRPKTSRCQLPWRWPSPAPSGRCPWYCSKWCACFVKRYNAGPEFSHRHSTAMEPATIPWDSLNSVSIREKLLVWPEPLLHVPTLDPVRMAVSDIYEVLSLLVKGQDGGTQPLMFTTSSQATSKFDRSGPAKQQEY